MEVMGRLLSMGAEEGEFFEGGSLGEGPGVS